jgi:hypothetical protein
MRIKESTPELRFCYRGRHQTEAARESPFEGFTFRSSPSVTRTSSITPLVSYECSCPPMTCFREPPRPIEGRNWLPNRGKFHRGIGSGPIHNP